MFMTFVATNSGKFNYNLPVIYKINARVANIFDKKYFLFILLNYESIFPHFTLELNYIFRHNEPFSF